MEQYNICQVYCRRRLTLDYCTPELCKDDAIRSISELPGACPVRELGREGTHSICTHCACVSCSALLAACLCKYRYCSLMLSQCVCKNHWGVLQPTSCKLDNLLPCCHYPLAVQPSLLRFTVHKSLFIAICNSLKDLIKPVV